MIYKQLLKQFNHSAILYIFLLFISIGSFAEPNPYLTVTPSQSTGNFEVDPPGTCDVFSCTLQEREVNPSTAWMDVGTVTDEVLQVVDKLPGEYEYRIRFVYSVLPGSTTTTYSDHIPVTVIPPPDDRLYHVSYGDIDNDGKTDLYVSGPPNSGRAVENFLLMGGTNFHLVANPTAMQHVLGSTLPISSVISVYRADLNFDGYLDFRIENIDEVIPDADDVIIYTKNQGTEPHRRVIENEQYHELAAALYNLLTHPDEFTPLSAVNFCVTYTLVNCHNSGLSILGGFDGDPESGGWLWDSWPSFTPTCFAGPIQQCYGSSSVFQPQVHLFMSSFQPYFENGWLECVTCIDATRIDYETYYGATVAPAGTAAVVLMGGLSRKGRLAIVARRLAGYILSGETFITQQALFASVLMAAGMPWVLNHIGGDDEVEKNPVLPAWEVDPFNPGPDCDPEDPVRRVLQRLDKNTNDSTVLGKNLKKMGCDVDGENKEAHHVVQGGAKDKVSKETQKLLARNGININEASNGVFLPRTANTATRAQGHRILHTGPYRQAVFDRLAAAENVGGSAGVRQALTIIRNQLMRGTFVP